MLRMLTVALVASALFVQAAAFGQEEEPPEKTTVSGRLMTDKDTGAQSGTAYWVFQRRLLELPHENTLEELRAMAETAVAVDEEGSFTLRMAPGNYMLVYEPGAQLNQELAEGGPKSFARSKQLTPEQVRERVERVKENAQKGLPIRKGRVGNAWVVENRIVRPPITEFGEILLGDPATVTIQAVGPEGNKIDFPVALRLRGKSGDVYEPHPPSISERGTFVFHDVFPQPYQVFGLPTRPAPGQGDEETTPSITNGDLLFTGEPLEWQVQVDPNPPAEEPVAAPTPPSGGERQQEGESAVPRRRR